MKLNDLDRKDTAAYALKANFDFDFNPQKLDRRATKDMLSQVVGLIKEAKSKPDFYKNQNSPTYMKLVFIGQALTEHYQSLKVPRIVTENEQVEKSQVILAAQDMIDSLQKMIEEVNDMLVKELPALTDSISSEIGANESQSFNQSASEALTTLNQTLSQSKQTMQGAMNQLTGVGDAMFGAPGAGGEEMAVTDIATQQTPSGTQSAELDMTAELPPAEEPEAKLGSDVGRAKR